jgi:hypothetical protein
MKNKEHRLGKAREQYLLSFAAVTAGFVTDGKLGSLGAGPCPTFRRTHTWLMLCYHCPATLTLFF